MPTQVPSLNDYNKQQNSINDLTTKIASLQSQVDGLKTKDNVHDDQLAALTADIEAIQSTDADQASQLASLSSKQAQIEVTANAANQLAVSLQSDMNEVQSDIINIQSANAQQDNTLQTISAQIVTNATRLDDHESRIGILEKKVGQGGGGGGGTPIPTPNTSKTGLDMPFYSSAMSSAGIAAAQAHPNLPMTFTINPASGPGTTFRSDIQLSINQANTAGKLALAYIATHWGDGTKSIAAIKAEIDKYVSLYTGLKGVFWDECGNTAAVLPFYTEITNYARTRGLNIVHANPGTAVDEQYVALFDIITISEQNNVLLDETTLKARTFANKYPKSKFSFLSYNVASLNAAWVTMAAKYVGSLYLTDDNLPNPWDQPATYLNQLLDTLEAAPASA